MNKDLYHEVVEIVKTDGTPICTLNSPYFSKEDVIDITRKVFQYTENFMIVSYQVGRREASLKEAV